MTTNQTIDGVPRDQVERALDAIEQVGLQDKFIDYTFVRTVKHELRALLDAEPAPCAKSQVEGRRERFQKWVMATKHPVFGFLDGRSLARGDDRTGYADEYVQGLWVAYLEFGAEQPAPVAVVMPERAPGDTEDSDVLSDCRNEGWNACIDEVTRLNTK